MKILDLGCGNKKNKDAIGIDIRHDSDADIIYDLSKPPFPLHDDVFDLIRANHIIEHLHDTYKTMDELWRISKPNAKIIIKVPHFSHKGAYYSPQHCKIFSSESFNEFDGKKFKIISKKLSYLLNPNPTKLAKLVGSVMNYLANKNIWLCERLWCYWVGGFGETHIEMKVLKNK